MSTTTALDFLLIREGTMYDDQWTPDFCDRCPFGRAVTIEEAHYSREHLTVPEDNDLTEGHYWCSLLDNKAVWGEHPDCTPNDWRRQARLELLNLGLVTAAV